MNNPQLQPKTDIEFHILNTISNTNDSYLILNQELVS